MLVVKNVSKILGRKQILHNINFCLKKGDIVALLGPNGSGKTTLMRCIVGFYELDDGQILFDGEKVKNERCNFLTNIAYVPETGGVYPEMSVYEYLIFMANMKHLSKQNLKMVLGNIIKSLGLESVINQKCDTLSKGFKRRTALAAALLTKPKLLILDEPTEGLDPKQKQSVRTILKEYGKTNIVLISTHVMEEVEALANRVLMIKNGALICDTTPDELKKITEGMSIENTFCKIIED